MKAGKTSDAETLLETSLFGLNQGAFFAQLGGKNTFEAAPNILGQVAGYTSATFHGYNKTFWNRNETYARFGYDYFFDASYYNVNEENSFQYGLHDKPFFEQSVKYLEHLQQPFYTKFISICYSTLPVRLRVLQLAHGMVNSLHNSILLYGRTQY